ncbi:N-carbamoylputrescine amidase [Myxococcus stipitatus DSM 14675]|uniref:N-carbamoylputrescine amidase n=1 Tax=Myxococcus stipitatus (strain DSM 14675 / JCM 12634 / Mx s8) TaxID=1278073 RepID=L7UDW6_MYXSD|nr:carbon-nitrogen hydrolase family protein [Myxococcus stipitatus]AGC46253.1 N-carbamoylputrescine amidase [Myxococcus stipitatus DSM 14675]
MDSLRVAALQLRSENGRVRHNLEHARPFIRQAVAQGARLVLLPEFSVTGYVRSPELWQWAETLEGPTVRFLRQEADLGKVFLGASLLEVEGEDFFNTFVLISPGGKVDRVRKRRAPSYEAYGFRGSVDDPCVIDCALGRISVGICADNHFNDLARCIEDSRAQLHLMPHCYGVGKENPWSFPRALIEASCRQMESLPVRYARHFGVPVVLANQCGPWEGPLPGLMGRMVKTDRFLGRSSIVSSRGARLCALGEEEEGVIVDTVELRSSDYEGEERRITRAQGDWGWSSLGEPAFATASFAFKIGAMEWLGRRAYERSVERRRWARRIQEEQGQLEAPLDERGARREMP